MKPGEFDDLVRQKFDQGDFEYNPRNWELLTDELDGQKKRRGGMLFWWMPLVGVAASVAMAFGVSTVFHHQGQMINAPVGTEMASAQKPFNTHKQLAAATPAHVLAAQGSEVSSLHSANSGHAGAALKNARENDVTISTELVTANKPSVVPGNNIVSTFNSNISTAPNKDAQLTKKKKAVVVSDAYYTFKEDDAPKKEPKVAIILSGGVSYSNQGNGYTVGATARRMINEKVYVESDIAFVGTNNTQKVSYMDYSTQQNVGGVAVNNANSNHSMGAKGTAAGKNTDGGASKGTSEGPQGVLRTANQPYNLYYAQVTPSVGYKIMKRMSVGIGPDFQQMLVDNRPVVDPAERGNVKVAPMFDIGFMGKTEIAVTRNVKAAVYYREGINNVITPTNKYLDRNYVQFQVKCNILNR